MNTTQLQCCIDCDPVLKDKVIGVFAADQLPMTLSKYPCGFIANTDTYSKPGQHWCAFYVERAGVVEFFDSYGQKPATNSVHFKQWIAEHGPKVTSNDRQIQSDFSSVCGLYCLYFLHQRLNGHSMIQIVNSFTPDVSFNDQHIHERLMHVYSMCIYNECLYNQSCKPLIKTLY